MEITGPDDEEDTTLWIEAIQTGGSLAEGVARLYFERETAVQVAKDILRLAGHAVVPAATPATLHGKDVDDERNGWNVDALQAAAEYDRSATFSYDKGNGVLETRTIIPERIDATKAGKLIVQGEDTDRDDTRVFRLDRIQGFVSVR